MKGYVVIDIAFLHFWGWVSKEKFKVVLIG
jgi:hypothetical protein